MMYKCALINIQYRHRIPSPTPSTRTLIKQHKKHSSRVDVTQSVFDNSTSLVSPTNSARPLGLRTTSMDSPTTASRTISNDSSNSTTSQSHSNKPVQLTTSLSISDDRTDLRFEPAPAVLVAGAFGQGNTDYFGIGCEPFCGRRIIVAHVGPVSSMHDRVCELFYMLKGGVVDYGAAHTSIHAHDRYGRTEPGLYAAWSEEYPLHFIGHSYGCNTILYLQGMLAKQMFAGYNTNANWIRSVSSIQAPMRGTTGVYTLGSLEHDASQVHWCSYTAMLSKFLHIYEYFDIAWLKQYCDTRLEMWRLSYKYGVASRFYRLCKSILGIETLVHGIDNCNYDLSIEGTYKAIQNGMFITNPNTHYTSYVASCTRRVPVLGWHVPPLHLSSLGYAVFSIFTGSYKMLNLTVQHNHKSILYTSIGGNKATQWWCNDGTASLISQYHYFACDHLLWNTRTSINTNAAKQQCIHNQLDLSKPLKNESISNTVPNVWHVYELCGTTTHTSIVPWPKSTEQAKRFWTHLYRRLEFYDQSAIHKNAYQDVTVHTIETIKKSTSTKDFWAAIKLLSTQIDLNNDCKSNESSPVRQIRTAPTTPINKPVIDTTLNNNNATEEIKILESTETPQPAIAVCV